jgi:hypothetical protein
MPPPSVILKIANERSLLMDTDDGWIDVEISLTAMTM